MIEVDSLIKRLIHPGHLRLHLVQRVRNINPLILLIEGAGDPALLQELLVGPLDRGLELAVVKWLVILKFLLKALGGVRRMDESGLPL